MRTGVTFAVAGIALALLASCTRVSPLAGGTSDTGNARVAGVAVYPDSTPAVNARVRIRPADYLPGDHVERYDVTTDRQGAFMVSIAAEGEYLVEVDDREGSAAMQSVAVTGRGRTYDVGPVLRPAGTLSGAVPLRGRQRGARVALLGLERAAQEVDSAGAFAFTAIPAGAHRLCVRYADTLLGSDTVYQRVEPGAVSVLVPERFAAGRTLVWTGAGGDYLAGNPANWSPAALPADSLHVRFAVGGVDSVYWDLPAGCASWTQTGAFDGTVVFQTRFEGAPVRIGGDARIDGGRWTHRGNDSHRTRRLWVRVGGDLSVGPGGRIDAGRKGFGNSQGPGAPVALTNDGAAYGGSGGDGCWQYYDTVHSAATYGSASLPVDPGSGADGGPGGGAILVDVGGTLHLDGLICADGANAREHDGGGAGGSIALAARSLEGEGVVRADGGHSVNCGGGGGGRVSIRLDGAQPLSAWSGLVAARGGQPVGSRNPQQQGRPGTIYFATGDAPGGSLLITTGSAQGEPW
jgi:hypothetical protein